MIFEPKLFYRSFLVDYHKYKLITLNGILNDIDKFTPQFFAEPDKFSDEMKSAYKMMLQSEMRQAYFHCVETLFEIVFGLIPEKGALNDETIMITITNSKPSATYDKIKDIANAETGLDFLDETLNFGSFEMSLANYIFYYGIHSSINDEFKHKEESVTESIKTIKEALKVFASDFIDREEYNSYKHGLRIIPATQSMEVLDAETWEKVIEFDLSNSMSFFAKTKDPDEVKVYTKNFDNQRDYNMTMLCSEIISNIIELRRAAYYKSSSYGEKHVGIVFFPMEYLEKSQEINVESQDWVYTQKRIRRDK